MNLKAIATQIRVAIHNRDRNTIDLLDRRFDLKRISRALTTRRLLARHEVITALSLKSNINNPSCRYA